MAGFTAYGYLKLRQAFQAAVTHIEIRNAGGTAIAARIPITDPRVTVYDDATTSPLGYQVVLTASDADMGVGKVVAQWGMFDAATGGTELVGDTFATPVTFNNTADKATLKLNITTAL